MVENAGRPPIIVSGVESSGFRIGFDHRSTQLKSSRRNMLSARENPGVIEQYLAGEVQLQRMWKPPVGVVTTGVDHPYHVSPSLKNISQGSGG